MSYRQYKGTGDGSNKLFPVTFPYIIKDYVKVKIDGVLTTDFTWNNDSMIEITTAPPDGAVVLIYSDTKKSGKEVDFSSGSNFNEANLDLQNDQTFNLVLEMQDKFETMMAYDENTSTFSAQGVRVTNLADGIASTDGATVGQIQNLAAEQANLPAAGGQATNYIRQKTDNTGLEYRTPAQVLSDIGAAPSSLATTVAGKESKMSNPVTKTSSYSIQDLEEIWVDSTSGAITVTLPHTGEHVRIIWIAGTNTVTLQPQNSGTFNGVSSYEMKTVNDVIDAKTSANDIWRWF
jgi:hypothetical protein